MAAAGDTGSVPANFRRLDGDEIRGLLVGRSLSFVSEPCVLALTSAYEEVYGEGGALFVRVDRGRINGRYRILSDRLCLSLEGGATEECRWVFASPENHISVMGADRDGPARALTRIAIR